MPLYAQLLSLNPTNTTYNYKYGATALYGDAEKKEEAVRYLKFASKDAGVDSKVWYFLGRAYHLNYQFADAEQAYLKFQEVGSAKEVEEFEISRELEASRSGSNLLSKIKDVRVLDKKQSPEDSFFRIYDLTEIGGKILVTPEELLSSLDKKNNHKSLIHFKGSGSTVYFSSYGKDGKNGLDIYKAEVLPGGTFSSPQKLGGEVNTKYDEDYPFMHPDNKTFYFSSKGHSSMGGYDIFKSIYDEGLDVFSRPENLDFAINTPDDDLFYIADSSKTRANFASGRSSAQGNLDVYQVMVEALPLQLTFVKGTFINQINSEEKLAKITVVDAATNKEVDIQYTDAGNGDYVIGFPKSGKYKFLVEPEKSTKVHAGIVDVPKSSGVKAYLQEMELITSAGVEKLLINNLFDQTFDGDISELAQRMLKQKSKLDVNFKIGEEPEPVEEIVEPEVQDIAEAYMAAGFSVGMSNEKILAQAADRSSEIEGDVEELNVLMEGTLTAYFNALNEANEKASEALELSESINADNPNPELSFKASKAKFESEQALSRALNARNLHAALADLKEEKETSLIEAKNHENAIREALSSENYEALLSGLKAEKAYQEEEAQNPAEKSPQRIIQSESIASNEEAERRMQAALSLRNQAEEAEARLLTKRRQLEKSKGRAAKDLQEEVSLLEQEVANLNAAARDSFEKAEKFEEVALNEREEFELIQELTSDYEQKEISKAPIAAEELKNEAPIQFVRSTLDKTEINNDLVAAYLSANPEAANTFGDDATAMRFKRNYASADSSADTYALNTSESQSEKPAQTIDGETVEQEETSLTQDRSNLNDENAGKVSTELIAGAAVSGEKNENASAIADNEVAESTSVSKSSAGSEAPGGPEVSTTTNEKKIQAERVKISAAEDWIAIIDASIAELESGVGGADEDTEEQLEQYRKLRAGKEAEIQESNSIIANLSDSRAPESKTQMEAYARASDDLDTLSVDLLARLESKIPDASSDIKYVKSVSTIDRDYLPELASIELSGKSSPEIAMDRIELNKELIASLDQILQGNATTSISEDDLLELRRIKTLEIQRDEEIKLGELAYSPRSPEAKEYTALLEEESPVEISSDNEPPIRAQLSPRLASQIAADFERDMVLEGYSEEMFRLEKSESTEALNSQIALQESYLRNLQSEIRLYAAAVEANADTPDARLNQRYETLLAERSAVFDEINANKDILASRDAELLARTEDPESTDSKDTLDEIERPQDELSAEPKVDALPEVAAGGLIAASIAGSGEEDSTEQGVEVDPLNEPEVNDAADTEIAETSTQISVIQTIYAEEVSQIRNEGLSESEEKAAIANLSLETAENFDKKIEELVGLMDSAEESERDSLQILIQEYDALAADMRQESDRLNSEVDLLVAAQPVSETPAKSVIEDTSTVDVQEDAANLEAADSKVNEVILALDASNDIPDLNDITYKSLNANIALNELASLEDSINRVESQLQSEIRAYQSETESQNKVSRSEKITELSAEASKLKLRMSDEIASSNAAEISYFQNTNAELLGRLEKLNKSGRFNSELDEFAERSSELSQLLQDNESANAGTSGSSKERVAAELILIQSMAELNSDLDATLKKYTPELTDAGVAESDSAELESDTETSESLTADKAYLNDAANYKVIPGNKYLTPIYSRSLAELSAEKRSELSSVASLSSPGFKTSNEAEKRTVVYSGLNLSEAELDKAVQSDEELTYLFNNIALDSLKALETATVAEMKSLEAQAREQLSESDRLKSAAASAAKEKDRKSILERANRLEVSAQNTLAKAALKAEFAEGIAKERSEMESELATTAVTIDSQRMPTLNAILNKETYTIIPSDLASNTISEAPLRPVRKASTDYADARLSSSDEAKLFSSAGNWLAMVEVIAEKEDFSDVEESLFIQTESPVYSDAKPIPIDPVMPDGLIFQVQVGAFRNPIPQGLFGDVAPIMGQKLENGITRYRAGIFRSYAEADQAKEFVRSKGYSDAFVVAYVDGERLSGAQARQILDQAREALSEDVLANATSSVANQAPASGSQNAEKLDRTTTTVGTAKNADYYNDPTAAEANQVEVIRGLFFTVQVGVYSKPVKLDQLYNLQELNSELTQSGTIRYTSGRYNSVAEASQRKEEAINKGVEDAFITAYFNGSRISLGEAAQILSEQGEGALMNNIDQTGTNGGNQTDSPIQNTNEVSAPEVSTPVSGSSDVVTYVVIMGTFGDDVPQSIANIFLERPDLDIRRVDGAGGSSMYMSGDFTSKEDAREFLNICKSAGITTAAMGTMVNGNITSVETE
jgi:hypothetical protein